MKGFSKKMNWANWSVFTLMIRGIFIVKRKTMIDCEKCWYEVLIAKFWCKWNSFWKSLDFYRFL